MKNIEINGQIYKIKDELWNKHLEMHPIRSEEVLLSNIRIVCGQKYFNEVDIERIIEDEYQVHSSFYEILEKANDIYEQR